MKSAILGGIKEFTRTFLDLATLRVDRRLINDGNNFIQVNDLGEDFIKIGKTKFYAVKVISANDEQEPMFDKIQANFRYSSSQLNIFYVKTPALVEKDEEIRGFNNISMYLISENRDIIEQYALAFNKNRTLLNGKELLQMFLEIGQSVTNKINIDTKSVSNIVDIPLDELFINYKKLFADGAYNSFEEGYALYKTVSFKTPKELSVQPRESDEPNVRKALKGDWKGYLHFRLTFENDKIVKMAKTKYSGVRDFETNKDRRNTAYNIKNIIEKDPQDFCAVEGNLFISNRYLVPKIESALNIVLHKVSIFAKETIYKTPVVRTDLNYTFFTLNTIAERLINPAFRNVFNVKDEIIGVNTADGLASVSLKAYKPPHFTIVAPTRSGKSFFLQSLLKSLNGITFGKDEVTKEYIVKNIKQDRKQKTLFFDFDYSARNFVQKLLEYQNEGNSPIKVVDFGKYIQSLRFGLTNIDLTEDGLDMKQLIFNFSIISLLLELKGEQPLTIKEEAIIADAILHLKRTGKFKAPSLKILEDLGGYGIIINSIKNRYPNISEYTPLDEIKGVEKDTIAQEYPLINTPNLKQVADYIKTLANKAGIEDLERQVRVSAGEKISSISSNKFFGNYQAINIEEGDFYYIELKEIASAGKDNFVPLYFFLFYSIFNKMQEEAIRHKEDKTTPPYFTVIFEEAHNLFGVDYIVKILKKLVREVAKYNMDFGFITQNIDDIPDAIANNIGTRILMPSRGKGRNIQYATIAKYFGVEKNEAIAEEIKDLFGNTSEMFMPVMYNADGYIAIKPYITKAEEEIFNSEADLSRKG